MSSNGLTLRTAQLSDIRAITDLAVPIVTHDGFHDFFFPYQDGHPEDMFRWWYRFYRNHLLKPYTVALVAETGSKQIVGLAIWVFAPRGSSGDFHLTDPKHRGLNLEKDRVYEKILRFYFEVKDRICDEFFPNRAVEPKALAEWGKTVTNLRAKLWSGEDRVHWYCPELFVIPEYREEGYYKLLQWGFDRGNVDELSCFAGCQLGQVTYYQAAGMDKAFQFRCGPSEGWIVKKLNDKSFTKCIAHL